MYIYRTSIQEHLISSYVKLVQNIVHKVRNVMVQASAYLYWYKIKVLNIKTRINKTIVLCKPNFKLLMKMC